MKLTQEEKRIKIAEACGWKCVAREPRLYGGSQLCGKPPIVNRRSIPDYFNDLNACHEVWKTTIQGNDELEDKYSIELLRTVGSEDPADGKRPNGSDATWALASNAPSSERAEAFGLTLNLWEAGQ